MGDPPNTAFSASSCRRMRSVFSEDPASRLLRCYGEYPVRYAKEVHLIPAQRTSEAGLCPLKGLCFQKLYRNGLRVRSASRHLRSLVSLLVLHEETELSSKNGLGFPASPFPHLKLAITPGESESLSCWVYEYWRGEGVRLKAKRLATRGDTVVVATLLASSWRMGKSGYAMPDNVVPTAEILQSSSRGGGAIRSTPPVVVVSTAAFSWPFLTVGRNQLDHAQR